MEPYTPARFRTTLDEIYALLDVSHSEAVLEIKTGEPGALAWTLQGFGMLRFYIPGGGRRVHVWSPGHAAAGIPVMHSHPWNFTSTVVSGEIVNEIYSADARPGAASPYMRQRIFCGAGGGLDGDPEEVWLGMVSSGLYTPGQRYRMEAAQIHVSTPSAGCVTVCARDLAVPDPDRAVVLWPVGEQWGSAEPRPATPGERRDILGHALEVWGQPA